MTGSGGQRVYLDWNATAPLRPGARGAMLQAMDMVGNASSVHAEGRAARAIVERARAQVAALVGCDPSEVAFTGGATEANAAVVGSYAEVLAAEIEHDSVLRNLGPTRRHGEPLAVTRDGCLDLDRAGRRIREAARADEQGSAVLICVAAANSETGVWNDVSGAFASSLHGAEALRPGHFFTDATQAVGKVPFDFRRCNAGMATCSAHKIGGPAGVGALIHDGDFDATALRFQRGGGQEHGRRAGTENVIGIAGFGAAAEAARRDLEDGVWERVARLRDELEARLESAAPDLTFIGRGVARLPNTSCFALPGWPGETQVMQMDLAGFAVSAGSACSSGKVERASRVLLAMGRDERTASSAIRVSLGPTTTGAEVAAFAGAWIDCYRRRNSRAA